MQNPPRCQAFSLLQTLVIVAIVGAVTSIAFPVLASSRKQNGTLSDSAQNIRQVCLAGIMYGSDYDDKMVVLLNGPYRSIQDTADGVSTPYGEQRTDAWPLLLIPYIKSRQLFIDPTRVDGLDIWSGPAKAITDAGYDPGRNTYRNQSRFPMYGMNYLFCDPGFVPADKIGKPDAMNYMTGASHSFTEADDPAGTIYLLPSKNYGANAQGSWVVNAPGIWQGLKEDSPVVAFWGHSACSGDWCYDMDSNKAGAQSETNSAYIDHDHMAPATFLDGHVKIMSDIAITAGTDYETATANDGARPGTKGGGCVIVDKTKYLWNLTDFYYGR